MAVSTWRLLIVMVVVLISIGMSARWFEMTTPEVYAPLGYNRTDNNIYGIGHDRSYIMLVDEATNTIIDSLMGAFNATAWAYNPTNNNVCCATYFGSGHDCVIIIDGASNIIITTQDRGYQLA